MTPKAILPHHLWIGGGITLFTFGLGASALDWPWIVRLTIYVTAGILVGQGITSRSRLMRARRAAQAWLARIKAEDDQRQ